MSKAIRERPEGEGVQGDWRQPDEVAPSVLREDEPTLARTVGLIGGPG